MITGASPAAQKLGYSTLKAKQMDVVMGIVSERDVFTTLITRYGNSLCYSRLPYTYDEAFFHILYHKFAVQPRHNGDSMLHMYNYYNMRIPPTTVMQLLRSLEIRCHKSLKRVRPDQFPIFEGGVRQCQTESYYPARACTARG